MSLINYNIHHESAFHMVLYLRGGTPRRSEPAHEEENENENDDDYSHDKEWAVEEDCIDVIKPM